MTGIRVISTSTVQAPPPSDDDDINSCDSPDQKIHLTPWDLATLQIEMNQKGLLFFNNATKHTPKPNQFIHHLKLSLSSTLAFFPPLAGRLIITHHQDNDNNNNNNASSFILCNNAGALFVHASTTEPVRVADILRPNYVPRIVRSFFPLNGVRNYEGTSRPLLAVQVTELLDGVFVACSINHVVADGKSFWHFINSWAEISRANNSNRHHQLSKPPSLERWFLDGVDIPIRFPFTKEDNKQSPEIEIEIETEKPLQPPPERIFHFTKEKIEQLKSKANAEANTADRRISSLQALLTHVWRAVIRYYCKRVVEIDPHEEICYCLPIDVRGRTVPSLPENYFGNAVLVGAVTVKAGEVVEGEVGKVALEINRMIASRSDDAVIKRQYECWVRNPSLFGPGRLGSVKALATSSSPRFDFYGNDFGWGKPVAVRSGCSNKSEGTVTVFGGAEEGSVDIEVCLSYEILEAMGNDPDFC